LNRVLVLLEIKN